MHCCLRFEMGLDGATMPVEGAKMRRNPGYCDGQNNKSYFD